MMAIQRPQRRNIANFAQRRPADRARRAEERLLRIQNEIGHTFFQKKAALPARRSGRDSPSARV